MIYEYAIEPELVVAWGKDPKDCRHFYNAFGVGTPRFMAEFPGFKRWRKLFREAWSLAGDTEQKRIEALFVRLTEKRIRRLNDEYDNRRTWLENAEEEHDRQAFHAVLSIQNPRDHAQVLPTTAFHEPIDGHPLWQVASGQLSCARKAHEMAELIGPLLANCTELHFVDPYFGPESRRHRAPLAAFLDKACRCRRRRLPLERVVIHTTARSSDIFFRQECEKSLPGIIPTGLRLELRRWEKRSGGEKLHNRYILTDIGGVKVDPGLDEGQDGESFEAILLERGLFEKNWADYVSNPAFDPASPPLWVTGECTQEVI